MITKLLKYIKGYTLPTLLAPITVILEVLIEVTIPFLMAKIIDVGIENSDVNYVTKMGAIMVGLAMVSLCFGALSGRFASVASTGFAANVRKALFEKIQDFSFANTDKFSTASLVMRMTGDVNNVQMAFMMMVRIMFRAPVMLVMALLMAININARLSTVFLYAVPFLGIAMFLITKTAFPRFEKMLTEYDDMNASVQENLIAARVVKAFVRKDYENNKFTITAEELRQAQINAEKVVVMGAPIMTLSVYACILAILWFGGAQVINETMLSGELITFITYVSQIMISLMMLAMIFVNLVLSRASVVRIIEVLEEKIDVTDENADESITLKDGSIEFKDVSFSYSKDPDKMTLMDVNLSIASGETIGIIGATGSAKTTLVQLIPRLYDVTKGNVIVGGHDVREYKLETLRNEVAMVLQKNVLFSGTIKENILWGNENATDEEIESACRAAAAYDFIMSFPDGYETDLGQGGVNVSGGQKQRLCIARALLKHPKITILDDSTSACDTATDKAIREAFKKELKGMTTIIIAQRIASVMDADRIVVMNDGRIENVGSHDELMKCSSIYREVFESQQKGGE